MILSICSRHALTTLSVLAMLHSSSVNAETAPKTPPTLKALEQQGVHFVTDTLPAPKGMKGWAAYHGQQPLAFYVAGDGNVIMGTLMDSEGEDMTSKPLQAAVRAAMMDGIWKRVEKSHWVAEGSPSAPRTLYVFTDPNCPYCTQLWSETQPWVKAGKVQIRHILVGILTKTSPGKAAAILASGNPGKALTAHETAYYEARQKHAPDGRKLDSDAQGIAPLDRVPANISQQLEENARMMLQLDLQATPALIWRDASDAIQIRQGVPQGELKKIMGPL
ncbi:thiol:disulfide interchange protein DsbG [Herbaspirillum sp. VT-16-41]|uniref:thiol:disulfide interchange protein DsbG n=1 Tax=Herbaspirillum sp. VT-16-41 TaxID=1953765 RepID=UPI00098214F2|nr:thiol:disulfide interchange protein DsbG [Herbaspirillum sp. VT-16-41]ONN67739.1 thiol:disulfide interchange protein DsbG [Herbaspirillum sp. VT-16-41]